MSERTMLSIILGMVMFLVLSRIADVIREVFGGRK